MKQILLTGIAGFIGFHTAKKLLDNGYEVIGVDDINDYYDPNLKIARLKELGIETFTDNKAAISSKYSGLTFIKMELSERDAVKKLFEDYQFDYILHLAAQAGVRYALENPNSYIERNIISTSNLLEESKTRKIKHFAFASSSSVYGANTKIPFEEDDKTETPLSLYAATKKSCELISYTYSHLFSLPVTGLRFFTVYGPWGRPDMSMFMFTKSILEEKEITLYNDGNMFRDFTYVDDIVESVKRILELPARSEAPFQVFNIGNSSPIRLTELISLLESNLGKKAIIVSKPAPKTEVFKTYANTSKLEKITGYRPKVNIDEGVKRFIEWYKEYHK